MKQRILEKNRSDLNTAINPLQTPLSEHSLLYVQNLFTTPGFHSLYVKNVQMGRTIIESQLQALQWYHSVGCLGTHANQIFSYAHNIIHEFEHQIINKELIESFFLEKFYYDFLWIEFTKELTAITWIRDFKEQLSLYRLDNTIPIISVYYT